MQIKIFKHCLHRDVKAESRRTVERRRDAMRNSLVLAQRQARRFQAELLLAIGSEGESV